MRRLLFNLLAATITFAAAHGAVPTTIKSLPKRPQPAPDGQRFLFVVEISSSMRSTDAANRQALFDMIFTGLDGQMRTGDTFGLWLFNDDLRAGEFPMQVWDEQNPIETASLATKFLREQRYSGKSKPAALTPRLLNLVKNVRDVNLLIISDGETPLEGTPFDANIAAVFERRRTDQARAQKPFVTLLVARGGAIISGAVILAGESLKLPERPAPAIAMGATNSMASPTNSARTAVATTRANNGIVEAGEPQTTASLNLQPPAPAAPPKPKVMQFVTRSNVAQAKPPAATPLPTNSPPPPPPAPLPAANVVASTAPPVVTNPPPAEPALPPPLVVAAREPVLPLPADARLISPEPAAVQAVAVPDSPINAKLLIVFGGVLLAACAGLFVIVIRHSRPARQGSVITQSMERK